MEERALQVGEWVRHPEFGDGLILDIRGTGDSAAVLVSFSDKSQRRLMVKFAKLERREPPPGSAKPEAAAKKGTRATRAAGKK